MNSLLPPEGGTTKPRVHSFPVKGLKLAVPAHEVLAGLSSLSARLHISDPLASAQLPRRQLPAWQCAHPSLDCLFARNSIRLKAHPVSPQPAFRRKTATRRSISERDLSILLTADPRGSSRACTTSQSILCPGTNPPAAIVTISVRLGARRV